MLPSRPLRGGGFEKLQHRAKSVRAHHGEDREQRVEQRAADSSMTDSTDTAKGCDRSPDMRLSSQACVDPLLAKSSAFAKFGAGDASEFALA